MNEEQWLSAVAPGRMLWHIQKQVEGRKPALFAAACLKRIWHLFPGQSCRDVVGILERYADGDAQDEELATARRKAREEAYGVDTGGNQHPGVHAAIAASYDDPETLADFAAEATAWAKVGTPEAISGPEEKAQADLVREIFGNPFRPVYFNPAWRSQNVFAIATGIYEDREFDRMPILSDALLDAGCNSEQIISHCREFTSHVRGCWVLDMILGK